MENIHMLDDTDDTILAKCRRPEAHGCHQTTVAPIARPAPPGSIIFGASTAIHHTFCCGKTPTVPSRDVDVDNTLLVKPNSCTCMKLGVD